MVYIGKKIFKWINLIKKKYWYVIYGFEVNIWNVFYSCYYNGFIIDYMLMII